MPFVKIPKLLKFSIIIWMQLSGFSWGAFPYAGLRNFFQFAGIFDSEPTVHVRRSDVQIQQAGNGCYETGQFGSLFG